MIKTLRFTLMAVMLLVCGAISAQEKVTLDFTDNTKWKFPEAKANIATEAKEFTDGTYTVTLTGSTGTGEGYYFNTYDNGYLMLGKKGATLKFPKFDFPVSKIVFEASKNGSGKVTFNIFVDDKAVSTEVTGIKTEQTFDIAAGSQAAGTQYVLKLTNANNIQLTKVHIYKQTGTVKKNAALAFSEEKINHEAGTSFTSPTFSKETTAEVKFSSNNENVAKVDAKGVIALGTEEGEAVITAESAENDVYAAGKATCTIYVWHYVTYKKATAVESGKKYLIVAQRDDKTYYAMPMAKTYTYGYLKAQSKEGTLDELKIESSYDDNFVFTTCEDGYSIQDCYGRYLYMDTTDPTKDYNSFNLGEKAVAWTVEPKADGTFTISFNNGKFIQFGEGTFTSFGAYAKKMDNTVLPMLFVMGEGQTGINNIHTSTAVKNNVMYNLAGQRVNKDYKGLVIMNGKKMMIK